jgi:hypothetical protein
MPQQLLPSIFERRPSLLCPTKRISRTVVIHEARHTRNAAAATPKPMVRTVAIVSELVFE